MFCKILNFCILTPQFDTTVVFYNLAISVFFRTFAKDEIIR